MKKIKTTFTLFMILPFIMLGQTTDPSTGKDKNKKDQSKLVNEFFVSYGLASVYIFTQGIEHSYDIDDSYYGKTSDVNSIGAFMIGYNRMLNRVLSIGFTGSYIPCNYTNSSVTYHDNLFNGIARMSFNYVNKPAIRIYSGFGIGVTVDLGNAKLEGDGKESEKKIFPAGQLTMIGIRFGRDIGGFVEFGVGTNSIISAGFSYQFGD